VIASGCEISASWRFDLDRLRADPLGHEAFQVGIDRSVLGGYGIEGRLGAASGIRRPFGGQRLLERLLNRVKDAPLPAAGRLRSRTGKAFSDNWPQSSLKTMPAVAGGVG
jgi:hypothetical protein